VLLAHRERSALPPFPDIVEIGHEHLTDHDVQRESGEQAVERALRTDVVIALERASEIVGTSSRPVNQPVGVRQARHAPPRRRIDRRRDLPASCGRGDIRFGVKAETPGCPARF
jgi:hypothetical protein